MKKTKIIYLIFSLFLSAGQFNISGSPPFPGDALYFPPPAESMLSFQARVYFGAEDEESDPVEADFYLLDESLVKTLKAAHFKPVYPDGKKGKIAEEDYLEAAAQALSARPGTEDDRETEIVAFLIEEAMADHRLAIARTNGFGRGYFWSFPPGSYYLFGIVRLEEQIVVWHLPVAVKPGKNSIELDQNNAAIFAGD